MIGNGFDLAHNLPTSYIDFMNFLEWCHYAENGNDTPAEKSFNKLDIKLRDYINNNFRNEEIITPHIKKLIKNSNEWYEYFDRVFNEGKDVGGNWVDFESLIAAVVKKIECQPDEQFGGIIDDAMRKEILYKVVFYGLVDNDYKIIRPLINEMRCELDEFIKCLDEYIVLVEKMPIDGQLSCIKDIVFDNVISFNYSNTYEAHYNAPKNKVIYIHGKAGEDEKKDISNLVVGCEETLSKDNQDSDIRCGYFKKYFQREIKNTGRGYRVCDQMKGGPDNFLYILGHSLDVNDGDIIKYLIENHKYVTIYYYNIDDFIKKVQNLVKILTKEGYEEQKGKINYKHM